MLESENNKDTESMSEPLRPSLFSGIPPYINYIPKSGIIFGNLSLDCGPQYWDEDQNWDQDQLWRYTIAMENWIDDFAKECEKNIKGGNSINWAGSSKFIPSVGSKILESKPKRIQQRLEIRPAFNQRPDDSKRFIDWHPGVKLVQFPRMHEISKKDLLGKNFSVMKKKYGDEAFGFHPVTYILPEDKSSLIKHMKRSDNLWIVKPPHTNNGSGVYVINSPEEIPDVPVCVQQYIKDPLLLKGHKFDIRVYVLLTSLDPLRLYVYDDGLVRIATEEYTEDPDKIQDCCIHVCNYAVNRKNTEKFIVNNEPDSCKGHKWRLKCLWQYLMDTQGLSTSDVDAIWSKIEDVVVKTVLSAHKDTRREFLDLAENTCYNSYRLLGYDLLIDNNLDVHLIEVNSKPQLSDAVLDKVVNRPLLYEMLRIIGYHIPPTVDKHRKLIAKTFKLPEATKEAPVTFEASLYRRRAGIDDAFKQDHYPDTEFDRSTYLEKILDDLTSGDLRQLVIAEEERCQANRFRRVVPSQKSHKYLQYMYKLPYYDKLLDAYEFKYSDKRSEGLQMLKTLCDNNRHI